MGSRSPFPKICIALGFTTVDALIEQARHEVESGETFLEFRLDYLENPQAGAEAIANFVRSYPECMVLATCRRHANHGKFEGSVEREIAVLESAIRSGASAVDVEIETAEVAGAALSRLREHARLIVSYHSFENTPPLDPIIKRLTRYPADAHKVATTARKPTDVERVLDAGRHSRAPIVTLAMGERGFPTRVLSPAYNSAFTYAAPSCAEGTAPGQVGARLLRKLYHADRLTRTVKIYCVIADPVKHSLSPAVHNRAFQVRHLDAVYVPLVVSAGQLRDFFKMAEKLPLTGFSVTIPHKQKIIRYLDIVDPLARRIGAVNTVWRKAGRWRGANTDAEAVVKPLSKYLRLQKSLVLIAGTGGAARSAACALADAGAQVSITGRNADRVRALARFASGKPLSREQAESARFDAVVHATPLGMFPNVDACFFRDRIPGDVVFDMVYNPAQTLLLKRAREQGKEVIPGMKMFIEQAVAQFELWTGDAAPRGAMEMAAMDALEHQNAVVARSI